MLSFTRRANQVSGLNSKVVSMGSRSDLLRRVVCPHKIVLLSSSLWRGSSSAAGVEIVSCQRFASSKSGGSSRTAERNVPTEPWPKSKQEASGSHSSSASAGGGGGGNSASSTATHHHDHQHHDQHHATSTSYTEVAAEQVSNFKKFVHTWQLGILGGIGMCMGIGTILYVFWQPFRSDATLQSTEVASNVLSDSRVKEGAVAITKEVVENVLRDPSSVDLVVGVLVRLLQQEGTRTATIIYLEELFNDPLTQDLAKRLIIDVARDDWTKDALSDVTRQLILDLLKEQVVRKALTDLLLRSATDALRNEELQRTTSQSVRSTVAGVVMPWT